MVVEALKKLAFQHHYRNVTRPRAEKLHASLSKHIGQAESILDIGCGDGVIAKRLGEAAGAKRVMGVDILLRPQRCIDVELYDGLKVPFADQSFEVVTIVDVLHHCTEPETVLRETLRVASKMVVIKDHFAFGPITRKILHYMDLAGNARDAVPSPGTYFEPYEWVDMIGRAGGQVVALEWPLAIHNMPWRAVVRPGLHFTAKVVPRPR